MQPASLETDPLKTDLFRFTTSLPTLSSTLNPDPVSYLEMTDSVFESELKDSWEAPDAPDSSLKFMYRRQRNLVFAAGVPIVGNAVATQLPSSDFHFIVNPDLPAGLSIDSESGLIYGTPQSVTEPRIYTILASTQGQEWEARLQLEVQEV